MSTETQWQEANSRYLSATLAWLRAVMEPIAAPLQDQQRSLPAPSPPPQGPDEQRSSLRSYFGRKQTQAPPKPPLLLPRGSSTGEQRIADSEAAMQAAAEMKPPPALLILSQRLGLSTFELQLLSLCIAMELDTGMPGLCAECQRDPSRPYPTFALGFALFASASWEALSPERPLRFWRLIEITQPGAQPLTTSALRADERIVNYCKGLNYLDDRLLPLVGPMIQRETAPELPPSHRETVDTIVRRAKPGLDGQPPPAIQLVGADGPSKQLVATEAARSMGLHLYRLPASILPAQTGDIETFARLWQRESLLLPLALYIDALGSSPESTGAGAPLTRVLDRLRAVVFLDTREPWAGLYRPATIVNVAKPTSAEQSAVWKAALGPDAGDNPGQLAAQFDLGFSAIEQLAQEVRSEPVAESSTLRSTLWGACLTYSQPQLDLLAHRIQPRAAWDDIVLPANELTVLRQIAEQVEQRNKVYEQWGFAQKMSRGLGVSALFSGDSGTGKTMAAEVIANELRINLYRIDLSAVVSKYIGETAKNLRRLFDSAENGGAILFFDEADALFGKRSEVKDSHDRFANIEINYLLQRMEAYRGLAILATNMKSALDPAFMRRLRFIITFPFPGPAQRKAIWQKVFPADMPRGTLDYDRLSRLHITGGNIHSVALNAAFLAAKAGTQVTMPLVLEAARAEFRKLERPVNETDFRWQEPSGAVA
jgi:hypothetical protein